MKKVFFLVLLYACPYLWGQAKDITEYVDPMIGNSDSRWMQFPGPAMPFGMVKLSPDNQGNVWRGGYEYNIHQIIGFSHIHSWTMGGLLTMPVTGTLKIKPGEENDPDSGYRSRISHENEKAALSYYSVLLDDYHIKAELTSTTRTGFQRYTFPASDSARILFDLENGSEYPYEVRWASISKVSDYEIEGFSTQASYDEPTNLLNDYTVYFVARVDKSMKSFGTWVNGQVDTVSTTCWGRHDVGAFMNFETHQDEVIQLKTGISYVSIEQARKNLETESGHFGWDFDAVHNYAVDEWRKILDTIEVEGGSEENKRKFYTNLYRSYCSRTIFSDVDGQYVDMYEQVRQLKSPDSPIYGCDAFWNTFWNLNQLWALATPDIMNQWVESLLEYYRVGGWLPNGPPGVEYCDIMGAQHEIPLIVSAYQKGIRNYDVNTAYEAIKKMLTIQGTALSSGGIVGNRHLDVYLKHGYVPYGEKSHHNVFGTTYHGPTSNTLEYAFDDWNAAQFAKALGKEDDYNYFTKRAYSYKNVFDPETKFVRPRYSDGTWMQDFQPVNKDEHSTSWSWLGSGFVEGNSWQYTWMVPHDMGQLVEMIGKEEFNNRLNEGFELSSEYNFSPPGDRFSAAYVNHGNQPCMQAAFLFNYSGNPWLTQYWTREMMNKYYGSAPVHGWPGDEDQGQGGAWFVMAAIGLFEVNGGGSVNPFYEISSPLFEKTTIHLDNQYYKGGKFIIEAKNVSDENRYIQSAKLNGKTLPKPWFYHSELVNGGKLELVMGKKPNKKWGSRPQDAPPSMSSEEQMATGVSAVASSSRSQREASKAVDNNLTTFWEANKPEAWIMVDLKTPYALTSICQVFQQSSVWKFRIEGSFDKENWLMLVDRTKGIAGHTFAESVSGVYRYVRLTVTGCTGGYLPSSKELIINGTNTEDKNLALGKQYTNVILSPKHTPIDAMDRNMSTYWLAGNGSYPQSFTVDLKEVCTLSGIQQIFKDHDNWRYKVEGSNDELQWHTLANHADGIHGFDFTTPVTGQFRYVRLTVLGSASGYWAHSCEFRIFGKEQQGSSIHTPEPVNLAFDAWASTSSFRDNDHNQKKAFDGNDNTFWYADDHTYPQWLCVDLGLPCDIRSITQTFAEKDTWSFTIEASNDNFTWDLIANCRTGIAGNRYSKELNGAYRYVKLNILDARNKSRASSRSLIINGYGSPRKAAWWEETSGMTRYYPKYYRQTLNSIKDSLDILKAQGYRSIELSAIYEGNPAVWAGLGATDNYAIDPSIGTLKDFENLLTEVHARDMRLTFFGNVGYCWHKAPFFEKACDDQRNNIQSKERNWFHFSDKKISDNWFWSDRAQAYYYSFWGNSDGAEGRIPSYNFNNREWQEECRNYLNFWADKGVDGILLDAPEAYDGITDDIINESIIKILNRRGILSSAEGSSDIDKWIGKFNFRFIQGFDIYAWGGGKRSEALNARRNHNPGELNNKLKNYRDKSVALGATTITPPMWEIPATNEERLFELAYLVSVGTMVINHYGDHHEEYIAQSILAGWPQKHQEKFYDLIRLQNSYNGLAPMGQRTCIPSNDNNKYSVFKRSNKDGKVSALVIMNFQDSTETISVDLKNTGIRMGQIPLNLLDMNKISPVLTEEYRITLPAYGYMILGLPSN